MPPPTLVIGTPDTSSWSLRPWLVMRHFNIPFDEVTIRLREPTTKAEILRHSPAGHVPILKYGSLVVWDSLAIIEYLADRHVDLHIWPADPNARAKARSISAEMHSGFPALREELPMEITGRHPDLEFSGAAAADIARIVDLWQDALAEASGDAFLFGAFSAADAMFAPVVSRFVTYNIALPDAAARYRDAIWSLDAMRAWQRKAAE